MINGVSFIIKNHSQMYAANQFIVVFVTFLLLKYVHVYVCMSASALLCVCFLCCISIHPLPAQSRQGECSLSSATTAAKQPAHVCRRETSPFSCSPRSLKGFIRGFASLV